MVDHDPAVEPARLHLSESPHGPSPRAVAAARAELSRGNRYPDPGRDRVRARIAEHYRLDPSRVAVGNGSDELVLLCSIGLGDTDGCGLTTAGTFPGYRICLTTVRRGCRSVQLISGRTDVDRIADELSGVGVAFICNPHNPTGSALRRDEMDRLVDAASRTGTPIVVDEAYMEFAPDDTPQVRDYLDGGAPVIALRTFSKAYGLAGYRIGYAVGERHLVSDLRKLQQTMPFSVNRVAQAAAVAALDDQDHLAGVRAATAQRRAWLVDECDRRGRRPLPSVTNFVAIPVASSANVEARLEADHRILVRDAGRFGFADHIRVSVGEQEHLVRLLDGLDAIEPSGRNRHATELAAIRDPRADTGG